jgi:GTPase SAR1 family protein
MHVNACAHASPGPWWQASAQVCKLTLVGNGSVGKTSICQRFRADGFAPVYRQTVGIDFLEKRLEVRCV